MHLALAELVDGIWSGYLGDEKTRWVKQVAVIYRELAAHRRLYPQAKTDGVGPNRAEVRGVDISRIAIGGVEDLPRILENISAVVEGDCPYRFGQRYPGLHVDDGDGIAAKRDRERIEKYRIAVAIT